MKRDLILFVNKVGQDVVRSIDRYRKSADSRWRVGVIRDFRAPATHHDKDFDVVISCNIRQSDSLVKALKPHQESLLALVCRGEQNVADYARIVPFVPYVRTPSRESLQWASDKISMRQHFSAYDQSITPKFAVISDVSKSSLEKVKAQVGFPLVVKPTGLSSSLLVNICFHEDELREALQKTFRLIKKTYKDNQRQEEPRVLTEQFMEGEMYSIDAYVDARGKVVCCPPVFVTTGRSIGFDDFFNYSRITPTTLTKAEIAQAEAVTCKAIFALNLRSVTAHVELIYTKQGFKVIELGPRVGGFRHKMYELSYGINHDLNDVLNRVPKSIILPKKTKGYTAVLRFYPRQEGRIKKIAGLKKIKELKSLVKVAQNKKVGDLSRFAKNGGKSVLDLTLFNASRSDLLADIRRAEKNVNILT